MKALKKTLFAVAVAAAAGSAQASFSSFWFDADGAGGADAVRISETLGIGGLLHVANTYTGATSFNFEQNGIASLTNVDGSPISGNLSDLTAAQQAAFNNVGVKLYGDGHGALNAPIYFDGGKIEIYSPAWSTMIGEFEIVGGQGSVDVAGLPNGQSTVIARGLSFVSGFFFTDESGTQAQDFATFDLDQLASLFGFSTTNLSNVTTPRAITSGLGQLNTAYGETFAAPSVDAFGRPTNLLLATGGQFRMSVPEPSSIALLGLGLVGLAGLRRRKQA
jgi:hypothetical protein